MDVKITAIVEECQIQSAIFVTDEMTVDILLGDGSDQEVSLPKMKIIGVC